LRFISGGLLWPALEPVQPRTATDVLEKCPAEMTDAGESHRQRRFRHILKTVPLPFRPREDPEVG
jgi:hypothetical protein